MRLQKCFRMIHLWPVVELICQSPSSQWREKQRPECLLNCVVMTSSHGWGAWLKVTRPRLDTVLLAKQKQAKHVFTKSSQRSQFSSVQSLSQVRLFATPWNAAHQASLSITNSWSLLKLISIESVIPSNHLILSSPSPPTFSNESVLRIRWPKDWSFSFSISPSNGYSGLISFRMDWLDLLAVQGTLKSLLQHYSS